MNTFIHTPTPDLARSLDFYARLGFETLSTGSLPIVTDGMAVVEINTDRYARAGVRIYGCKLDEHVPVLEKLTKLVRNPDGYLLNDPNGVRIYLTEKPAPVDYQARDKSFGIPGNFSGLSIETTDMEGTVNLWKAAGFTGTSGDPSQGWATCFNEDGLAISIMKANSCPHLFFNPSFTYFNSGKNPEVISAIRKAGIPITEEITVFNKEGEVDNIIIRDPGGYGFFVFND